MTFLPGKKTYIQAGLGAVVTIAWALGVIPDQLAIMALGVLGFGGLAAMRAGAKKAEDAGERATAQSFRVMSAVADWRADADTKEASKKARKK